MITNVELDNGYLDRNSLFKSLKALFSYECNFELEIKQLARHSKSPL
jgi:hypothetical protein